MIPSSVYQFVREFVTFRTRRLADRMLNQSSHHRSCVMSLSYMTAPSRS